MAERKMPQRKMTEEEKPKEEKAPSTVSRRSFLVGAGAGVGGLVVGGAVGSQVFPKKAAEAPSLPVQAVWIGRDLTACTGCKLCQIACSQVKENKIWPATARITLHEYPPGVEFPIACYQCGSDAKCVEACEVDALSINQDSTIAIDTAKCLRTAENGDCTECADACPGAAVTFHPVSKAPLICDVCGGDPECVKVCPKGALVLNGFKTAAHPPEQIAATLARMYVVPKQPAQALSSEHLAALDDPELLA